ncbi:RNA-binding cell elongation regulator Jag/EloR [Streptococcus salivarius]|uniref:RNA-binding cell elongation regulator Jag/EloR n=1 Tax=Streptococcus salivarius TaxID=1304 RepID=UPI000E4E3B28|nr:RNA-binding cell elongation regulator Jag/EloR [Streptococcus salivarius]RGQ09859.1 protein jag [Streptococcus salivarius]
MVVYSGRTVEQAIEKGLKDLNLPRMKAHIKVISREKKGFLGFGKKPARVSVEPINEKITHEANQITVSDNKEIAHEDLKQPVSTETLDEELPDKKQEQPKATIIPLSVKRESSEGDVTEFMANSLEPQLEPVAQVQTPETSEGDFSSFVASEFSSDESSENNLEDIQGAADDVLSYLEKIIYEMDVDASLEVSHNRRNIIIQIETDQPSRVIGYHGKVLKSLQLLAQNYLHDRHSKRFSVVLNVRDYLEQRTETLIDLAEKTAAKVKETGREYVMDPMTNSERKIIHKALSQIEGVESHSEGDDPNRYVVVTKV